MLQKFFWGQEWDGDDNDFCSLAKNTFKNKIKNICLVLGKEEIDDPKSLHTLLDISRTFEAQVHVLTVQNTEESFGYSKVDMENESNMQRVEVAYATPQQQMIIPLNAEVEATIEQVIQSYLQKLA